MWGAWGRKINERGQPRARRRNVLSVFTISKKQGFQTDLGELGIQSSGTRSLNSYKRSEKEKQTDRPGTENVFSEWGGKVQWDCERAAPPLRGPTCSLTNVVRQGYPKSEKVGNNNLKKVSKQGEEGKNFTTRNCD